MKPGIRLLLIGATCSIGACGQTADDPPATTHPAVVSVTDFLSDTARENGLTVIDITVPFEKFVEAPARLKQIANAIGNETPGLYVMRYADDTLRHTYHVFAIRQSQSTYTEWTSLPAEIPTRKEFSISGAEYDEPTKTLTLHTPSGDIRLTPTDVTSVGA